MSIEVAGGGITAPIRVIVCDPHEVVATGIGTLLAQESDIEVVAVAVSATQLAKQVQRHSPDVVIVEWKLEDANCAEAIKALKQTHPSVKVLILTSLTDPPVLVAATHCSALITKHSGAKRLIEALRFVAAGGTLTSSAVLGQMVPGLRSPRNNQVAPELTARELEILEILAEGLSTRKIATRLFLSPHTVRNHIQAILSKLGAHSRLQAVSIGVRKGFINRPNSS